MTPIDMPRDAGDRARAELADAIDRQRSPLGLAALDALAPMRCWTSGAAPGRRWLQFADRVGAGGRVIGVDIAPRALAVARRRTAHLSQVTLRQADAAALDLDDASLDGVFSRFGSMFFADQVAAFANLRRMLRPGGRIGFVCWRSLAENALDRYSLHAAGLTASVDAAPFSLERPAVVERSLKAAGFEAIVIAALDRDVSAGDLDATLAVVTRVGALGMRLREQPALLPQVRPRARVALSERVGTGDIVLAAATWIVTATAG